MAKLRLKMADGTIRALPTLLIREVRIGRHTISGVLAGIVHLVIQLGGVGVLFAMLRRDEKVAGGVDSVAAYDR